MTQAYNKMFHESHSFKKTMVFPNVKVTPELASDLLRLNQDNRPLKNSVIDSYVTQMKAGKWLFAGDTIKISSTGRLLDGQHRLHALLKADKPQIFNIQTGLEEKTFEVMDTGRNRTAGDTVAIQGFRNANHVANTVKALIGYYNGGLLKYLSTHPKFTNTEVVEYIEALGPRRDLLQEAVSAGTKFYGRFKPVLPTTTALFLYLFTAYRKDKAWEFFELLTTGENIGLDRHSAVYLLRQRLINGTIGSNRIQTVDKYALIIKAWNYYIKERQIKRLAWESDEQFPEIALK